MNLVDPSDFCRCCRGRGYLSEEVWQEGRYVNVSQACWHCDGTGHRTVLVLPKQEE